MIYIQSQILFFFILIGFIVVQIELRACLKTVKELLRINANMPIMQDLNYASYDDDFLSLTWKLVREKGTFIIHSYRVILKGD